MYKVILTFCFIFTVLISIKSRAQMTPPPPLENKVYDSMVGDWSTESQMMGMPFIENLKIYWDLNHQFIVIDMQATGKDNTNMSIQRKGILGIDAKGNAKTWRFDSWGASQVSAGTGFFDGDVLTISDGNDVFNETRTISVNGNEMTVNAKGTIVTDGKNVSYNQTTVYKKNN